MPKYAMLRQRVAQQPFAQNGNLLVPEAASDEQIQRAHNADYLQQVVSGRLSDKEIRRIGFPWSPQLVERSRRSVGGTIGACRSALVEGVSANLAGGTHHAYADHGEGFCVFNDIAVAARAMQAEGRCRRVLIIDLDVHQGNGTAAIFTGDESVFTFSAHGAKNFPFHKERSDLDLGFEDGTGDEVYLEAVWACIQEAIERSSPDLAIYLAGADPFEGDALGRLSLSKKGLEARDRMVFDLCRKAGIPVATVMGGGYAKNIEDTVDIHFQTILIAAEQMK